MTAMYDGQVFETPLLAQWAAFFDLAGWRWNRGVARVGNWQPDFRVSFACGHSECGGSHTILVSVLPVADLAAMKGHPALTHFYGVTGNEGKSIADAGALFGESPSVSTWQMSHGAGGGIEDVFNWVDDAAVLWREARRKIASSI